MSNDLKTLYSNEKDSDINFQSKNSTFQSRGGKQEPISLLTTIFL